MGVALLLVAFLACLFLPFTLRTRALIASMIAFFGCVPLLGTIFEAYPRISFEKAILIMLLVGSIWTGVLVPALALSPYQPEETRTVPFHVENLKWSQECGAYEASYKSGHVDDNRGGFDLHETVLVKDPAVLATLRQAFDSHQIVTLSETWHNPSAPWATSPCDEWLATSATFQPPARDSL